MMTLHSHPVDTDMQSVINVLAVLECLMREDDVDVSDIAPRLGVSQNTAHRLLNVLCARDLAQRNPDTGRYQLGLHLAELGQMASDRKANPVPNSPFEPPYTTFNVGVIEGGTTPNVVAA